MSNSKDTIKFNPEEWREAIVQMRKKGETESLDTIAKLGELLEAVNAERFFVAVVANVSFGPEGSISEVTHGDVPAKVETLAFHAYPVFGKSINQEITPWQINECIGYLDKILALRLVIPRLPEDSAEQDAIDHIVASVRSHAEVVRGSAYPEQTANEITSIQGHFDNWFAERVGIKPTRAQAILWSIIRIHEQVINSVMPDIRKQALSAGEYWQQIKSKSPGNRKPTEAKVLELIQDKQSAEVFELVSILSAIAPEVIPVNLKDIKDIEPRPTLEEWKGLKSLIGLTKETRLSMSETVDVRRRPLFVLPDDRVILVDISNALDVLWESFEQVAKTDEAFYSGRYRKVKTKWLQQNIVECLLTIFPSSSIYQNLAYPDPDKNDGSTAELDVAVYWDPFLILIEAKAKQFRLESQLGDVGRLRSDIKKNVEDAFDQAKRAANYIYKTSNPEFTETSSGRRLRFSVDKIRRIYLLTVSQHLLAGLATRLSTLRDLGLFSGNEYPFSISIADLETVTHFCDGPDIFLHYIEKRLALQRESLVIGADELDFFGAYLQTRLQPARLWDKEGVKPNFVSLLGFSAQFDDWVAYKRHDLSEPPNIKLEIPDEIRGILEELRRRSDYASRWIAFALLDFPDSTLYAIDKNLSELRKSILTPGMFRSSTYADGDTVVSIVGSLDLSSRSLEQRTKMRAVIEKYRHKAVKSVGIGIMVKDTSKPFHCATWVEGPWEQDDQMEELIQNEPPFIPAPGTKIPGRNAPCLCGSRKKFKHCCLPKIEYARKHMG